jgi:hypothetical protein
MAMGAAAALVVVAAPAWVMRAVSERTGVVRAQDRWAVQVQADAARLAQGRSPYVPPAPLVPIGREAFSSSFRLEPPAELIPDQPLSAPGTLTLVALLRPLGLRDPRPLLLAALVVLAAAAPQVVAPSFAPAAVALALVPPLALGSILGSPVAVPAAALVASFLAARRHRPILAGFLAGMAAAFDARAALVAPFALLELRPDWRRSAGGFLLGYALLVLPAAWPDWGAWLTTLFAWPPAEPGVGVANVFLYWGGAVSPPALVVAAWLATAGLLVLVTRGRLDAMAGAAIAALAAVFLSAGASPEALGLPIMVLGLAGQSEGDSVRNG